MAPLKPMLAEIELQLVQKIDTEQDQTLSQHSVPALEGDFLQRLGRRASAIRLSGVMTGPESGDSLKTLREKFRAAEPVTFVADIATATKVDEVIIEELAVRELAGKPQRFAYTITLRELLEPPQPQTEEPPEPPEQPEPPPPPDVEKGTIEVEVTVEGDPDFDFGRVVVTLEGTNDDGSTSTRNVSNRSNSTWTESDLQPGGFTVKAATLDPQPLTDIRSAQIQAGQTTRISLTIAVSSPVATTFLITFRFDKAFVEPCAREVLKQVVDFSNANPSQKLLIAGHTDEVDTPAYNQSLSERRARSVFAFLTAGRDPAGAFSEWNALRQTRPAGVRTGVNDNWGLRQAQHMLQDLGFYPGNVDGQDGPLTQEAVRAFRCQKGLPPGNTVDDDVMEALIKDYLAQDAFNIPADRFFTNCPGDILKWVGVGEEDPVRRTGAPFRPSRRVEMLFVRANSLPCQVPQPDTFGQPAAGSPNNAWCLGPGSPTAHGCFTSPILQRGTNTPQPCSTSPTGPFCRQPAEPGTITVQGSIKNENGTPARNQPFVIIAANGEFLPRESGNGEPVAGVTDSSGKFSFADKRVGFYNLEVRSRPEQPPLLIRLDTQQETDVRGNSVCKALRSNSDSLDVVIVDAPTLREIRLPAAVHLMTALHPLTREVRTCPATVGPPLPQRTAHSAADVQGFFAAANVIWRKARVRLLLADADILREAYSFRTDCEVDGSEFVLILERCAYPNTVNFFFFGDLDGSAEAGFHVASPIVGPRRTVEGCAVTDRFQGLLGLDQPLNAVQTEQTAAHEFGHFLGLAPTNADHVPDAPANRNRLMLAGTRDGSNRTLVATEVTQARSSPNAGLDCLPLNLRVSGATRIGGARSHEFMVFQNASGPVVTIDAEINPRLLDPTLGTLALDGGNPGANAQQRTVSTAATGATEIVATYSSTATGATPVITFRLISVVTFDLRVDGATRVGGPTGTTFVATIDATQTITVTAVITPSPFCVPFDLVTWAGGVETSDPLRRSVSRATGASIPISATLLGTTRTITLLVMTFTLKVQGALQIGARNSTTFAALLDAGSSVTVIADVLPAPTPPVPLDFVTWTGGVPFAGNALRRNVTRGVARTTPVSATIAGDTKQVTIQVIADPSVPGPFAVGELEYTEVAEPTFVMPAQGTFNLPGPGDPVLVPFPVRKRALIRYPATAAGVNQPVSPVRGSYPLVVILHGNHRRRRPSGAFVESYRGLEYIARHLASHGYIAISIDADDINARDDLIFGRGTAIIQHIGVMNTLNTTHPTLTGRIDMGNAGSIALIGHSRGAEGVVAAQQLNTIVPHNLPIRAVVSIAPTNSENFVHSTTPYLVLYGTSDGDVSGESNSGNPFLLYDRASPPKAMVFVYGAIHNRFSTNTDWLAADQIDNDDARMISEAAHQSVAKGFCLAFLERHLRNVLGQDLFFSNNARPQSVAAIEMHQQYQDPTRTVVDDFEQLPPNPLSNTLTQAVAGPGLAVLTEVSLRQADTPSFVQASSGVMLAWDNAGAIYTSALASSLGTFDASTFQVLSFRITQRLGSARNTAGTAQDFFVRLTDTDSESAAIRVGAVTSIPAPFIRHDHNVLHPPPLPPPPVLPHVDRRPDSPTISKSALKTIRIRLDDFKAANTRLKLNSLRTLTFEFRQTARGEVAVDDIEFSI